MNHTQPPEDRSEYRSENGLAAWWVKDGAWHIARPIPDGHINPSNLLWTAEAFGTRGEAIAALDKVHEVQALLQQISNLPAKGAKR